MPKKESSKNRNVIKGSIGKVVTFFKKRPIYFLALLALLAGSVTLINASAANGDCSNNSIVRCGGFSSTSGPSQGNFNSNVKNYHNGNDVDRIYDHYGIDDTKLGSLPLGSVKGDGTIWLNGVKVATGARTTGREPISRNRPGCSNTNKEIRLAGRTTIYERDTCVSFKNLNQSLQAWVKLDANGKFKYAVLTDCGNPTTGTPTYVPPKPTGSVKCDAVSVVKVDRVKFRFIVKGSKTGAAVLDLYHLDYGDKTSGKSPKGIFEHTYAKPGTYKIQGAALGRLNGGPSGGAGPVCATTITVEKPPEQPKVPNFSVIKYVNDRDANDNNSAVSVRANQEFEYKVVVTNTGETKLTKVKVWDILPAGVTYVDNTLKLNGSSVNNDSDFFDTTKGIVVPSIEKTGDTVTFTLKAVIKAELAQIAEKCTKDGRYYNNIAKADPEGALPEKTDPAVVKCSEVPRVERPAVYIEKDVSKSEVQMGEEFTWYLAVTNTGDVDLRNVKVTDRAPANIDFISSPAVAGTQITVSNRSFEAVISNLKVGQVVNFEIKAKVTAQVAGEIVNTACVDAEEVKDQGDNPAVDDCDDAKVRVPEEKCPVPGRENLPKNSTQCEAQKCPIPGLEEYDASSDLCKSVPETPNEVPSTGGGELILMSVVALVIGSGAYAFTLRGTKRA